MAHTSEMAAVEPGPAAVQRGESLMVELGRLREQRRKLATTISRQRLKRAKPDQLVLDQLQELSEQVVALTTPNVVTNE